MKNFKVLTIVFLSVGFSLLNYDCLGQKDTTTNASQFFVGLNYGTVSLNAAESLVGQITAAIINPFSDVTERSTPSSGTFFLKGGFTHGNKLLISLALGYERQPGEVIDKATNQQIGTFYDQYLTAALETARVYGRDKTINSKFYFYGVIGLGYVKRNRNVEGVGPNIFRDTFFAEKRLGWYVAPIAFSYGQRLRLNVELGLGYRGQASFTLHYRLQDYKRQR